MSYLVGAGRSNEHTDQRVIAGDSVVSFQFPRGTQLNQYDGFEIAALLDEPRRAHGTSVSENVYARDEASGDPILDENGKRIVVERRDAHVWHCSLSVSASEGSISDEKWEAIARRFMDEMAFDGGEGQGVRWVAIHHGQSKGGNDHIHIVAQMVREDGTKANFFRDMPRSQQACRVIEREFGLEQLESAQMGQGLAGDKPAERARASAAGAATTDRSELRRRMRTALASASSMDSYLTSLRGLGVRVAPSFKRGSNVEVRGYSVSLGRRGADQRAIWYSPSKLDASLGWPQIRQRYSDSGLAAASAQLRACRRDSTVMREMAPRLRALTHDEADRMFTPLMGVDTLANIFARVSMEVEGSHPGPVAAASEAFSRIGQRNGNALYAVRLQQRFASKRSDVAWLAVARQANRVARVLLQGPAKSTYPRTLHSAALAVAQAERIVRAAEMRTQAAVLDSGLGATHRSGSGSVAETDYGR